MKLNSYQQQLLQILKIKSLSLNSEFQDFSLVPTQQQDVVSNEVQQSNVEMTAFALLSGDIRLLLSQLTPAVTWQTHPQATSCYCEADVLITPELSVLQQATFKRQLWQLLNTRLNDV